MLTFPSRHPQFLRALRVAAVAPETRAAFVMADGECLCRKCAHDNARLIARTSRDLSKYGRTPTTDQWAYENTLSAEALAESGLPNQCAHCAGPLYTPSAPEARPANPQYSCATCGTGFDFGCPCD